MPEGKQPYFITTPIYYVNAKPHLGTYKHVFVEPPVMMSSF